jgi:protein TonB
MIMLSHEEFAASDISRLPSTQPQTSPEAQGSTSSSEDDSVGQGPHGEKLYNAEWYREPTHAEMATYLPAGLSQAGWAVIACRTIEHYHVEDCQELTEDPPGTGLAGALRLASWQFLVRPPRIGGRTMVGAWVRIRFNLTQERKTG